MGRDASDRLADLLEGRWTAAPSHDLAVLARLAEALGRHRPAEPDPVFRRRLREQLVGRLRDP